MIVAQCLVNSIDNLRKECENIDRKRPCLVQIFTSILEPDEAVSFANEVQGFLPLAQIIGSSVCGIISQGEQYDQHTIVVIEQYESANIWTNICSIEQKDGMEVTRILASYCETETPDLLRLFVGAYYYQAHQLIDGINKELPNVKVVGGMSGELYQSETIPFVFDSKTWYGEGLVCAGIKGENLSIYNRVNTAHESIGPHYTITESRGKAIHAIEGECAKNWIQRNLGLAATTQYKTWEDIANHDPLVRFQLALDGYTRSIRFVRYIEETQEITQYFSRSDVGTKFRISYTSPTKCVEECRETCLELQNVPIQQLFCYDCLFRKMYLKNCAKWELTPYHKNPVSGVFLLGEFGYSDGMNQLLNGSCVLSGIAEEEKYIHVDLSCLDEISSIQSENEGLFDFLLRKKSETKSLENVEVLSNVVSSERSHLPDLYKYMDPNLNMQNILKYELDCKDINFDKLCLLKIENTDMLRGSLGQTGFYALINSMVLQFNQLKEGQSEREQLHIYAISTSSFILADDGKLSKEEFLLLVHIINDYSKNIQSSTQRTPVLLRFIVVCDGKSLLSRAYAQLERYRNSQSQIIVEGESPLGKLAVNEEFETIELIRYALANDRVIPYYQGIYNNEKQCIDKYEALMRIARKDGTIVSPMAFMDIAKKYRLYLELNLEMFKKVMSDFKHIDCEVTINLSAHDITSPKFLQEMERELRKFSNPSNITFEILEDEYFTDMQILKDFIILVRKYGVKIAIDDFGSGYSNLLEIIKIHPDYLKIDGEIIREIHKSKEHEAIVNVVANLGKELNIDLVAEFVENGEIQKVVNSNAIRYSQGYFFSKPQPFEQIKKEIELLK